MNRRPGEETPSSSSPNQKKGSPMGDIENPWHSRSIDVHRWSDHPEVVQLCDRIWDGYLPNDQTTGPKPKGAD